MSFKLEVELEPFAVPISVRQKVKIGRTDAVHNLTEIPEEVLAALCDQFRSDVFRKAGKPDPRGQIPEAR